MNAYLEAARPKTLTAAIVPVLVGTAVAQHFSSLVFVACLATAVFGQITVNYANDLFDGIRGVDTEDRTGPRRAMASGLLSKGNMIAALLIALGLTACSGLMVVWLARSVELLVVGVVCVIAALTYSGGPFPYASHGLGEVMVMIFFGLVPTIGSQFAQDGIVNAYAIILSIGVGLMSVAILLVNNLRDIPTDKVAGKHTLPVRLGDANTRTLYTWVVVLAYGIDVLMAWVLSMTVSPLGLAMLFGLIGISMSGKAIHIVRNNAIGMDLIPALEFTAKAHLLRGIGLTLGIVLVNSSYTM